MSRETRETMLEKSFYEGMSTGAVNFTDRAVDSLVLSSFMQTYAKKHQINVSDSEIDAYIRQQFAKMDQLTKDFSYDEDTTYKLIDVTMMKAKEVNRARRGETKMTREEMLKKAYDHALSNAALRFVQASRDVDLQVIKMDMATFAEKEGYDLSENDIVQHIENEFARMDAAVKDFTYQTKMMN